MRLHRYLLCVLDDIENAEVMGVSLNNKGQPLSIEETIDDIDDDDAEEDDTKE